MEDEGKIVPMKFSKEKIREIANFGKGISYIRTPHARTLVHQIAWNASILHQNSEQRCEQPIIISPKSGDLV